MREPEGRMREGSRKVQRWKMRRERKKYEPKWKKMKNGVGIRAVGKPERARKGKGREKEKGREK